MSRYKSLYDIQRVLDDPYLGGYKAPENRDEVNAETLQAIREIMSRPDEPEPDTRYDVNWYELAEHYAADCPGLIESDDDAAEDEGDA